MLQVGESAPLVRRPSSRGEIDLAALAKERPLVLYFFPKAFTPG
jgi:peroxiredoxin